MADISVADHLSGRAGSYAWHYKNSWVNEVASIAAAHDVFLAGSSVLEMGAGVHNPLGGAIVALAQGARHSVAVEPSPLVSDHFHHAMMVGLIANYMLEHAASSEFRAALDSLVEFTHAEASGSFFSAPGLELFAASIEQYVSSESFDIVHSNAVLEHVLDFDPVCSHLFSITAPGGIHVHKVDFIDHRYYDISNPDSMDAFRFLMEGQLGGSPDCNGLRLSEVVSRFERAGFEYVSCPQKWSIEFPEAMRPSLLMRYKEMSREDLETTCAVLVFRKSAVAC